MKENNDNGSVKGFQFETSGMIPENGHKKSQDSYSEENLAHTNSIGDDYIPFSDDNQVVTAAGTNQAGNVVEFANKRELIHSEILKTMPKPGRVPCYLPVFDPYRRGETTRFGFKLNRNDWTVKEGRSDKWIEVKAEKNGQKTDWTRLSNSDRYKEAGYSVPDRPKLIGIDWLRGTGWGDHVFITEDPMDYWALNNALSYDRITEKGGVELAGDEMLGCAVMPWHYDFSERDVNSAFKGKKVIVMDYGNHERATEWAERLSIQDIADSVSVWRLDPALADKGLFLDYYLNLAQTPSNLRDGLNAIWEYLGTEGVKEALEPVVKKEIGGSLRATKHLARPQKFLLYPYLPEGDITVIAGMGGIGKSTVVMEWVKRLTEGNNEIIESRYEQDHFESKNVIWFSREESFESRMIPRAIQLGIDANAKTEEDDHFFQFPPKDCWEHDLTYPWYKEMITTYKADLVIIDSFQMFIEGDTNNGKDTRDAMRFFSKLSAETGVTVLLIHHFNKKSDIAGFHEAVSGSHVTRDMARCMCVLVKDPEAEESPDVTQIILHPDKMSGVRGKDVIPNLIYRLEGEDERDAIAQARLIKSDFRSEQTIIAQLERKRKEAKEMLNSDDSSSAAVLSLEEYALDRLESDGYILVSDFHDYGENAGVYVHDRETLLRRLQSDEGLVRRNYNKTVFPYLPGFHDNDPAGSARVYVRPCDVAETPEGLAKIANACLKSPAKESDIKALGITKTAKIVKAAAGIIISDYEWVESDGLLYEPKQSPELALVDKIKELGKRVTLDEATEMAGGDKKAASEALEVLKGDGWLSDRDGLAVMPPPGLTRRGNNVGQELFNKDDKAPLY